jgi:hypothetical protein
MSREIDFEKPLSDEDKEWLHEMSMDWRIEENDRRFDKEYQESEGYRPEEDANKSASVPRQPANFATDQFATGPVYPVVESVNAAPATQEVVEEVDVEELTVEELKDELRGLDQPTTGTKAELQKRLTKALG